jgi:hypothetical protein
MQQSFIIAGYCIRMTKANEVHGHVYITTCSVQGSGIQPAICDVATMATTTTALLRSQ